MSAATDAKIAEFKAARAAAAAKTDEAAALQELADYEAIAKLEAENGYVLHVSQKVRQFVEGCPVRVGVRPPSEPEYKRFFSKVNRAAGQADARVAALNELAQVCWVYPTDPETRARMIEKNAALLASVGNLANKLAELEAEEEGKD